MNSVLQTKRFFFSLTCFLSAHLTSLVAEPSDYTVYGLARISEEQQQFLETQVDKVIQIELNELGLQRIQEHLDKEGLPPLEASPISTEEFKVTKVSSQTAQELFNVSAKLPSAVNNSTLPSFPPIGDQGSLGACVGFGSTYYQATHEIGLLSGYDNKSSQTHVLSPKWTYNLLNDGLDQGLSVFEAFALLNINGATSILNFPYDSNYTAWELDTTDWVNAIPNRTTPYTLIPGLDGDLTAIKQALTNGHVLTFATFINSWNYTRIKIDPENINNAHVGEAAATYMSGTSGGHFMTIVGYDDTLWIDLNNNNRVDANERGAFLIANSWGTSWGNNGFIWISYDAFKAISAVSGGPSLNRVPAGTYLNSCVISITPKAKNYTPTLIAEMSLTQSLRNQINVKTGASNTTQNSPNSLTAIPALSNQGGAFNFGGTKSGAQTMTFAIDLSDFAQPTDQRYYLTIGDNKSNNPTTLNSYSLIDLTRNKRISTSNVPLTYDNSSGSIYIDYNTQTGVSPTPAPAPAPAPTPPPPAPRPTPSPTPPPPPPAPALSVAITTPSKDATLRGSCTITASTSTGVSSVNFYLDNVLLTKDKSAPFTTVINTTKFSNGTHQIKAIAQKGSQTATATQTITINNISVRTNVGGPTLQYSGNTWNTDSSLFTGVTTSSKNTVQFTDPTYNTNRVGNMNFTYSLPNGSYFVKLKFAETVFKAKKKRIFNVFLNNKKTINNLDIFSKVGANKAYEVTLPIQVTNGKLLIGFNSVIEKPLLNAIEITPR